MQSTDGTGLGSSIGFDLGNVDDDDAFPGIIYLADDDAMPVDYNAVNPPIAASFSTEASSQFFEHEKSGFGTAYLVSRSQFQIQSAAKKVDRSEVELQMAIAGLAVELSRDQRDDFGEILGKVYDLGVRRAAVDANKEWRTRVPSSGREIRRVIMKGQHAIVRNTPRPEIVKLGPCHAYASLKDCIQDLLGRGIPTDDTTGNYEEGQTVRTLGESRAANRLFPQYSGNDGLETLKLWVVEWSDDFEPNNNKTNRGSVWLKTVTVAPPRGTKTPLDNTYPVAAGPKGESHEVVEDRFAEELKELADPGRNVFYSKRHGGPVRVAVRLLASLQDQPERRSANHLMAGNGKFSGRFGYSVDTCHVCEILPSCDSCFRSLLKGEDVVPGSCGLCMNWTMDPESDLMKFPPPAHYPPGLLDESGLLSFKRVTYEGLTTAVRETDSNVYDNAWDGKTAKAFLHAETVNHESIEDVVERAEYRRTRDDVLNSSNEDDKQFIESEVARDPLQFEPWALPALWNRGIQLRQHVEAIMHLLFLGVANTTVMRIVDWAKGRGKFSSFLKFADGVLEQVQALNLSWCKAAPYTGEKLGGWVSENYLALGRLIKWFYSTLDELAADKKFEEPKCPQKRWTAAVNRKWLSIRGLDTSGSASDVRERVAECMSLDSVPEPLPPRGGPVQDVQRMVIALNAMLGRLMAPEVNDDVITDAELHIKIFLTCFHRVDQHLVGDEQKPKWVDAYNFLSLFNLVDIMREYGPLRNLWEGGAMGEAILQLAKSELTMGLRLDWFVNLLVKMHQHKSLAQLSRDRENSADGNDVDAIGEDDYFTYPSSAEASRMLQLHRVLSVVQLSDGTLGCVLRSDTRSNKCLMELEFDSSAPPVDVCGLQFYPWTQVDDGSGVDQVREFQLPEVVRAMVLLPKLTRDERLPTEPEHGERDPATANNDLTDYSRGPMYAAIDKSWCEMREGGYFDYGDPSTSFTPTNS